MMEANTNLSEYEINNSTWDCSKCRIIKTSKIFPFGLEDDNDIQNIMNTDSMKLLDNLPNFDIMSKAASFDPLKGNDLNENMVYNIKSLYYSAHEFQSLEFKDSLNIFHSNFNGLEHKFDQLHCFLNSSKIDFDIINISETSQFINQNFSTNISLSWF